MASKCFEKTKHIAKKRYWNFTRIRICYLCFFRSECGSQLQLLHCCDVHAWILAKKLEKKIHRDTKVALRGWLPERPEHLRIRRNPAVAAADEVLGEMHCDVTGPQI